jgi:hypothetical protein
MIERTPQGWVLIGTEGRLLVPDHDDITPKLAMIYEAHCEGKRVIDTVEKFGYSKQRYYQLLNLFMENGAIALQNKKRGPKGDYRRTDEVVRQVIRYRFLDPNMSPEVIAQNLNQNGFMIAARSVQRVISDYGLQKKTPSLLSRTSAGPDRNSSDKNKGALGVKRSKRYRT